MFQKMFRDFATKEVAKVADQADKQEELPAKLLKRAAGAGLPGRARARGAVRRRRAGLHDLHPAAGGAGRRVRQHGPDPPRPQQPGAADARQARHRSGQRRPGAGDGRGERIGAFALTEAGAGSDPTRLRTVAVQGRRSLGAQRHQDLGQQRRHRRRLRRLCRDRSGGRARRASAPSPCPAETAGV